jgi:hypothetical protein
MLDWIIQHWLRFDRSDNIKGLLRTVDILNKSIFEDCTHLEGNICKERLWKSCIFPYGLHFAVFFPYCNG